MRSHEEEYEEAKRESLRSSVVKEEERDGLVFKDFRIEGYGDETIPGLLVHGAKGPSGKLFLFVHGLGGSKEDVINLKEVAEPFGFSMLAIDARRHGDRKSPVAGISATDMITALSRTIVDNRLAIDVALQKRWAEEGRIILAGVSMGGILGGVIGGVDKRISGVVLYVPGGDLVEILSKSKEPTVSQVRRGIPTFVLRMFRGQLATVDPINYIDKISPRPLLIQLGRQDDIVPFENGMKLFERAKEPKHLVVHDSGHQLPMEKSISETVEWMRKSFPSLIL